LAGTLAHFDTQQNVAASLGITQGTVTDAKRGLIGNSFKKDLKDKIEDNVAAKKGELKDTILSNLSAALAEVGEKLHTADVGTASKVAIDMSRILDKVTGNNEDGKGHKTAIIINVPAQVTEAHYKTVEV